MRDDTPVKYESIVPSLTGVGVREARRRGRVPAVSVWVSLSVCLGQGCAPLVNGTRPHART